MEGGKEGGIVSEEGWLSQWVMEGGKEGRERGVVTCTYMYVYMYMTVH